MIKNVDLKNFVDIFLKFFCLESNSRMALIQFINLGGTQLLIKMLGNSQHADTVTSDLLIQEVLWILGEVINKKL